jgi:hypothetical protein
MPPPRGASPTSSKSCSKSAYVPTRPPRNAAASQSANVQEKRLRSPLMPRSKRSSTALRGGRVRPELARGAPIPGRCRARPPRWHFRCSRDRHPSHAAPPQGRLGRHCAEPAGERIDAVPCDEQALSPEPSDPGGALGPAQTRAPSRRRSLGERPGRAGLDSVCDSSHRCSSARDPPRVDLQRTVRP